MKKNIRGTSSLALLAVLAATDTPAGPVFYNTGVDDSHQQLSGGSRDPHYLMRQTIAGAYAGNAYWTNAVAMNNSITWGSWVKPADARWIYLADAANLGQDWGTYEFMTTFDLTGYDPATAVLAGQWAFDQYGTVSLNGTPVTSLSDGNWNDTLNSFSLTSGFQPGINVLTFSVRFPDGGDGMIVSGASLSATPLPALTITPNPPGFTVAWPTSATNYVLESTTNLAMPNWVTNTTSLATASANYFYGTNLTGSIFFRLKK